VTMTMMMMMMMMMMMTWGRGVSYRASPRIKGMTASALEATRLAIADQRADSATVWGTKGSLSSDFTACSMRW
jgi:hypothetical protein